MTTSNPARIAELTPTAKRTDGRTALTPDQVRQLVPYLDGHRLGAMFLVMLATGLRPGEAAGLHWANLDLDAATLHAGRTERNRPVVTDELKTAASRRTLALPAPAVAALRAHRTRRKAERLAARSWADKRLVFPTSVGTPLPASNLGRELEALCKEAGVPVVRPNELRHTAASAMSDAGVPLEEVGDQLGHVTTRMLEKTYRHRVRPSVTASVAVMDDLLADDG